MNELLSAVIPTSVAYVTAQMYCNMKDIPFFMGGTKSIKHKIAINVRNLTVGMLTSNFILSYSNPFTLSMPIIEEIPRMIGYSLLVELYFYWIHRTLHENTWLYQNIHKEHHLETVPSPIDAYILTLSESVMIVSALMFPLIIGYDITKRGAVIVQTLHLIVGILLHGALPEVNHHMIHHSDFNTNYGGSYPLWDNVFGTRIHTSKKESLKIAKKKPKSAETISFTKIYTLQPRTMVGNLVRQKRTMKPIWNLKGKLLTMKAF